MSDTTTNPISETATRREVLTTLAACGCYMAVATVAGAAAPMAGPDDRLPPAKPERSDVGAVADFAKDGIYDKLARSKQMFLIRAGGKLYAATSVCSHKRCILKKKDETATKCPCHQSEFDTAGIPMSGPAKVSLTRYAIAIENGRVFVDTNKSFAEKDWGDPSASVAMKS